MIITQLLKSLMPIKINPDRDFLDQRLELYEKLYLHEISRKEMLLSRLNFSITLGIAVISLTIYLIKESLNFDISITSIIFWILSAISITSIFSLLFFLWAFVIPFNDEIIPDSDDLEKYHTQLIEYYESSNYIPYETEVRFKKELLERYSKCATIYARNNLKRSHRFYQMNCATACAIVFMLFSIIPFQLSATTKDSQQMSQQRPPPPTMPPAKSTKGDNGRPPSQKPK